MEPRGAEGRHQAGMIPVLRSGLKDGASRPGHGLDRVIARSACDEAIQSFRVRDSGLLRFARNDAKEAEL